MNVENAQVQQSECVIPWLPLDAGGALGKQSGELAACTAFTLILGQLYYLLDIFDLMLNLLPLGGGGFLMELPALASQVASTNGTIFSHFTLFNLPLRGVPVAMIVWHIGDILVMYFINYA